MSLRLKRLPDTPHRIALGLSCGVFVCFSPFFGLHFFYAALIAFILRGNVLASLIGTFFGNPLTFPFIGVISYRTGLWLLGEKRDYTVWLRVKTAISDAFGTIWTNIKSVFGYEPTTWDGFVELFHNILVPYTLGGIIPGFIVAVAFYFISKPLIVVYQNRRKGRIIAKIKEIREKRAANTGPKGSSE